MKKYIAVDFSVNIELDLDLTYYDIIVPRTNNITWNYRDLSASCCSIVLSFKFTTKPFP